MKLLATLFFSIGVLFAADLAGVHTIYVDDLGARPGGAIIRETLINRLSNSRYFNVVAKEENSDATLTGLAETGLAVLRLVDDDGRILWTKEAKPATGGRTWRAFFGGRGSLKDGSSSLADKIVNHAKNLL